VQLAANSTRTIKVNESFVKGSAERIGILSSLKTSRTKARRVKIRALTTTRVAAINAALSPTISSTCESCLLVSTPAKGLTKRTDSGAMCSGSTEKIANVGSIAGKAEGRSMLGDAGPFTQGPYLQQQGWIRQGHAVGHRQFDIFRNSVEFHTKPRDLRFDFSPTTGMCLCVQRLPRG
jgi:hypothetical protein